MQSHIKIFYSKDWSRDPAWEKEGYELLDTGGGEKLERFGPYTFVRPYEDAVWPKTLKKEWDNADGRFLTSKKKISRATLDTTSRGGWKFSKGLLENETWRMSYKGIRFSAFPTPFRHLAFFPEQASHWDFIEREIKDAKRPVKFLNLFGYTGVASLFALRAGAQVTHLDASKQSLDLAKENQKLNPLLADGPMRVILDDALKFLAREEKRGSRYDAIIMDPPKFGRGPKGEVWKIEEMLPRLLLQAKKVLSDAPLFMIVTSYATDSSSLALGYALRDLMKDHPGETTQGELSVPERSGQRFVPLANTAVWRAR